MQHMTHEHQHPDSFGQSGHAATWSMALSATLHCLAGCAIGEIAGMIIGVSLGLSTLATVILAISLAFITGYALSLYSLYRRGVSIRRAARIVLAADTLSITIMEIVDNAVMVVVPGAMESGLMNGVFWLAMAAALLVAFVVTLPVNYWLLRRGKGHALVHDILHSPK